MPLYTVDNPSKDLGKATDTAKSLLGDNLVEVSAVNPAVPSRVSVETKEAINSTELSIALANLVPKAVVAPDSKGTEVTPVTQPVVTPSSAPEPAAPAAPPEPAAPAAPPVKIVP